MRRAFTEHLPLINKFEVRVRTALPLTASVADRRHDASLRSWRLTSGGSGGKCRVRLVWIGTLGGSSSS